MPINICKMDDILQKIHNIETNTTFQIEILNGFQSIALDKFTKLEESFSKFLKSSKDQKDTKPSKTDVNVSITANNDNQNVSLKKAQDLTSSINKVLIDGITQKGIESFKKAFAQIVDLKSALTGGIQGLGTVSKLNTPALEKLSQKTGKDDFAEMVTILSDFNKKQPTDQQNVKGADYTQEDVFKDQSAVKLDGFSEKGKTEFHELFTKFFSSKEGNAESVTALASALESLKALKAGDGGGLVTSIFKMFGVDIKSWAGGFVKSLLPKVFSSIGVGIASIAVSLVMFIKDGIAGMFKAKEWGVSGLSGFLGGFFGGVGKDFTSRLSGQALKWGLMGLGVGTLVCPGIGSVIGAVVGAAIGAIYAWIGGERIAKFFDAIGTWIGDTWEAIKTGSFSKLWIQIKKLGSVIFDGLKWLTWDMPMSIWTKLFDYIGVALSFYWGKLKEFGSWLSDKLSFIPKRLMEAGEMISEVFNSAVNWVEDKISSMWTGIKTNFENQFKWFDDVLGGIPSKIVGYVKDMWNKYAPGWLGGGKETQKDNPDKATIQKTPSADANKTGINQQVDDLKEIQKINKVASITSNVEIMKKMDETSKINQDIINTSKELNAKSNEKFDQMIEVLGGIYGKPVASGGSSNTSVIVNNATTDAWMHRSKFAK